ncbi:MAG TPA: hypothetical protein VNY36_00905, partial [Bacteroidia bacterium]|nr:hypothetical protein [Bacteroidia bacterium]
VQGNVDSFILFGFPAIIPTFWPATSSETTRFRSAVTTKVIQRFGLLDSTIVTDLGSRVKTQNLAYDAQTGEVLLTKTANDYDDPIYNLTYPAYWYYDGMGQVYKNIGLTLPSVSFASGFSTIANAQSYFEPGDELILSPLPSGSPMKTWVTNVATNGITVENENGTLVGNGSYSLEIVRSGRRNMQTMDMAKITTLVNPINSLQSNSYQKITQASAKVYTDSWRTYCNCFDQPGMQTNNPYVLGIKGDFHLKTSFLYLTQRDQSNFDDNTNARRDGIFTSYNPFYSESGGLWTLTPDNWTFTSTVTDFNPYGQEIEDRDALGRYSSATFGFNQTLPTAVAANAKYAEIGFDGFEDWGYNGCADNHFDMNRSAMTLDASQSHTGRHSLLVGSTPVVIGGLMTTCTPVNPCNISLCAIPQDQTGQFNLALQPSGGAAPYTYSYNVTSGNANVTLQSDGNLHLVAYTGPFQATVSVVVTDSKGCKYNTNVTLSESTINGGYTITGANTNCQTCNVALCYTSAVPSQQGYVLTLSASGGTAPYTYSATLASGPPPTSSEVTYSQSGNNFIISELVLPVTTSYNVTVTDANGCKSQAVVTITAHNVNGIWNYTVSGVELCSFCTTTTLCYTQTRDANLYHVFLTPSGGTAPYTYNYIIASGSGLSISTSGNQLVLFQTNANNFKVYVTVTDANGCSFQYIINGTFDPTAQLIVTGVNACP